MAPYRQFSNVQNLGDKKYFPLRISRFEISEDGSRETTRVHERFVFLTASATFLAGNLKVIFALLVVCEYL